MASDTFIALIYATTVEGYSSGARRLSARLLKTRNYCSTLLASAALMSAFASTSSRNRSFTS
jgi:hypothetical protein